MGRNCKAFLLVLGFLPPAVHAERYRVDALVFLDNSDAGSEATVSAPAPDTSAALDLSNSAALAAAGIDLLPDEPFGLGDSWQRLRNSRQYQPILRLSWIQDDPPAEHGPRLRVRWGLPMTVVNADGSGATTVFPVDGTVALLLGRYLHLESDLAYAVLRNDGALGTYRLKERRRLRRDELHHLDSPRLGILAKVQKVPA